MRILELTNYTAGACGVGARVLQESIELGKIGHEVRIFSSNFIKGKNENCPLEETIGKVKIKRFPAKKLGGESFLSWEFEKAALDFKPEVIIAHAYRHKHTTQALELGKKLNCKVFLVTHAPFIENDSTRSFISKLAVKFYDSFLGPRNLRKFTKIISITQWEYPYLRNLGIKNESIVYIPNGIPNEFFHSSIKPFKGRTIMFLGRIASIKQIETLVKAFKIVSNNSSIKLKIIGPEEEPYASSLRSFIEKTNANIEILPPIYDLTKKIKAMQESDIFVLPSKREAMPQALIEAMSLGKIVISSKTQGGLEIIQNGVTGFLFNIGDELSLAQIIEFCLNKNNSKLMASIQKNARKKAEEFKWNTLVKQLNELIKK